MFCISFFFSSLSLSLFSPFLPGVECHGMTKGGGSLRTRGGRWNRRPRELHSACCTKRHTASQSELPREIRHVHSSTAFKTALNTHRLNTYYRYHILYVSPPTFQLILTFSQLTDAAGGCLCLCLRRSCCFGVL